MQSRGGAGAVKAMPAERDTPPRTSQPPGGAARIGTGDDPALVAQTLAGERAAFGVLVERYAAQARRVALAVLGDPDDPDGAAEDGVLSSLVNLGHYDSARALRPRGVRS